jgi:phosphohistidine phosphatase
MNVFILRHASAGTRRINPKLDLKRPLDKEGKQYCLQLAHVLQAMKIQFDAIFSSPLKRALQTAVLTGTENGYEAPIRLTDALAPAATLQNFQGLLQDLQTCENVLLVGHSPNLEAFLGSLIVSPTTAPAKVRLRKGSLARVSIQRDAKTLMWMLDPRTVRALYAISTKGFSRKTAKSKSPKPNRSKSPKAKIPKK